VHIITVIDSEMKSRIERIVSLHRGYESMDEFIRRAILNQIALEESEVEMPARGFGREEKSRTVRTDRILDARGPRASTPSKIRERQSENVIKPAGEMDRSLLVIPVDILAGVDMPKLDPNNTARPLWGQMNRLAPAKVSLRILANILAKNKTAWADLKVVSAAVCEQAPIIKGLLQDSDLKTGRKRGEGFAAAFPTDMKPSLQRFTSQYVGYIAKESGEPQGLLADLSLVNIRKSQEGISEIGITEPGVVFTKLPSPLVDSVLLLDKPASLAVSLEEAQFLVAHLQKYRPGELDFLRFVARRIGEGASNPTALLTAVDDYFKEDSRGMSITDAVLGTMRTGAVSKLVELGVIAIKKDGARSTYQLTGYSKLVLEGVQ
jgi:hypothetical protein